MNDVFIDDNTLQFFNPARLYYDSIEFHTFNDGDLSVKIENATETCIFYLNEKKAEFLRDFLNKKYPKL